MDQHFTRSFDLDECRDRLSIVSLRGFSARCRADTELPLCLVVRELTTQPSSPAAALLTLHYVQSVPAVPLMRVASLMSLVVDGCRSYRASYCCKGVLVQNADL